eukprot:gene261-752_t
MSFDQWRASLPKPTDKNFASEKSDAVIVKLKGLVVKSGSKQLPFLQKCLVELYNRFKSVRPENSDALAAKCYVRNCTVILTVISRLAEDPSEAKNVNFSKVVMALLATFQSIFKAFPSDNFKIENESVVYEFLYFFSNLAMSSSSGCATENINKNVANDSMEVSDKDWLGLIKVVVSTVYEYVKLEPNENSSEWVDKWIDLIDQLCSRDWKKQKRAIPENIAQLFPVCRHKAARHAAVLVGISRLKFNAQNSDDLVLILPSACEEVESATAGLVGGSLQSSQILSNAVAVAKLIGATKPDDFFRSHVFDLGSDSELYGLMSRFLIDVFVLYVVSLTCSKESADGKEWAQVTLAALSLLRTLISKNVFKSFGQDRDRDACRRLLTLLMDSTNASLIDNDALGVMLQTYQVGASRHSECEVFQSIIFNVFGDVKHFFEVLERDGQSGRQKARVLQVIFLHYALGNNADHGVDTLATRKVQVAIIDGLGDTISPDIVALRAIESARKGKVVEKTAGAEQNILWMYFDWLLLSEKSDEPNAALQHAVISLKIVQAGLKHVQQGNSLMFVAKCDLSIAGAAVELVKREAVMRSLDSLGCFFEKVEYTAASVGYREQFDGIQKWWSYTPVKCTRPPTQNHRLFNKIPCLPDEVTAQNARCLVDCLQQANNSFSGGAADWSKVKSAKDSNIKSCGKLCESATNILKSAANHYDGGSIRRAAAALFSIALRLQEDPPRVSKSKKIGDEIRKQATELLGNVVGVMSGTMASIVDVFRDLHREGSQMIHKENIFSDILSKKWLARVPDSISLSFIRVTIDSDCVVFCSYVPGVDKLAVAGTDCKCAEVTKQIDEIIVEDRALREQIISARKKRKAGEALEGGRPPRNTERLIVSNDNMKTACEKLQSEFGPAALLLFPWHRDSAVNEKVIKWAGEICPSFPNQIILAKAILAGFFRTNDWKNSTSQDVAIGKYLNLPVKLPKLIENLTADFRPLSLFIDPEINNVPFESLPLLQPLSITRAVSPVHFIRTLLRISGVETVPKDGFYVMNPGGDLNNIEKNLLHVFAHQVKKKKIQWQGTVGAPGPGEKKALFAMGEFETFLHLGHGHGQSYLAGNLIQYGAYKNKSEASGSGESKPIKATTLMMGCCSAKFLLPPGTEENDRFERVEPFGAPLNFLIGGAPCTVGCLWAVESNDIDSCTQGLLERWINSECEQGKSLGTAIAKARQECNSPFLNGAALVVYGVPT